MGLVKFFRDLSLGIKLNVVVVLALAVPLGIIAFVADRNVKSLTVRTGAQRVEQEAEVIQGRFEETEQEILAATKVLASRPGLTDAIEDEDKSRVRTIVAVGATPFDLDFIVVIRSDQSPIAVLPEEETAASSNQVNDLLSLALLGVETTDFSFDQERQKLWLLAAVPLRHSTGDIIGAMLTSRQVDDAFLADINFYRDDVHVALLTEDYILAQDLPTPEQREDFAPVPLGKALAEQSTSGQPLVTGDLLHSADGSPYALTYSSIGSGGDLLAFSIKVDLGELSAFQRQLTNNATTIFFSLAVLAVGTIALLVWRSVSVPIGKLRSAAEGMTSGDYEQRAAVDSTDEIGQLANAFNILAAQLKQTLEGLEERATDLQRQTVLLQTSAEVSYAAASILDVDELIQRVVELIQEQFDLYYTGLFLVDEAKEWAVLQAGTGEAGRAMLARGHRIRIGEGMIGWSVANAQARIALDIGEEAVRLDTAELPNTRSEAALPLRSRGQVLGALTVQSDQPDAFDQTSLVVWQTMADQVALALDNAHLLTESQEALEATRRAYSELSSEAWTDLLRARPNWSYSYDGRFITLVEGEWHSEMREAARIGQSVQGNGAEGVTLAVPLKVRDHVVGVLNFYKGQTDGVWTSEEITLLETLTDQMGQALENARLYQDTQRRAAREQLTRQIADEMQRATNMKTLLRIAAEGLNRTLGSSRVYVRLNTEPLQRTAEGNGQRGEGNNG